MQFGLLSTLVLILSFLVIGCIIVVFTISVIAVKNKIKIPRRFNSVFVDDEELPMLKNDFFKDVIDGLKSEGFVDEGNVVDGDKPELNMLSKNFINYNEAIKAIIIYAENKDQKKLLINFNTEFQDGSDFDTTSNMEPGAYIKKNKNILRISTNDWRKLLSKHREYIERFKKDGNKYVAVSNLNLLNRIAYEHDKDLQEQAALGIIIYEPGEDAFKYTLYGAFKVVYDMLVYKFRYGGKKNKTIFDTIYRRENKKLNILRNIRTAGFVLLALVLINMKSAKSHGLFLYEASCMVISIIMVVVSSIMLMEKDYKDEWK